jgi:hypothetical protein
MPIHAVSPSLSRYVGNSPDVADLRLQTNAGEGDSCWLTALKVAGVIAAIAASAGSFVFLGPIAGVALTAVLGVAGFLIYNSCGGNAHSHTSSNAQLAPIPWHQRIFSYFPSWGGSPGPVRGRDPHVPVGQGHQPPVNRGWYSWLPFLPDNLRYMNSDHVPVGRGHGPGGRGGGGPANHEHEHVGGRGRGGPGGHEHVGGGRPPRDPHGHGPGGHGRGGPPSGASGHTPVGRGHY